MEAFRAKVNQNLDPKTEAFLMKEFFYLLRISCVFPYMRGNWLWVTIFQFGLFFLLTIFPGFQLLYTTSLIKDYQLSIAAQTVHIAGGLFVSWTTLFWLNYNRGIFIELATMINLNFYDYGPSFDTKQIQHFSDDLKRFKGMMFKYLPVLLTIIGIQALFAGPFQDHLQGMEITEAYINNVFMHLPVPIWCPFEVTNQYIKYGLLLYEVCTAVALLTVLCSGIMCIFFFSHSINVQCKILNTSIANIESRALHICQQKNTKFKKTNTKELYNNKQFVAEFKFCIKQNVEHHLIILRAQQVLDTLQKWPMFQVMMFMSLVIACALFTVLKGEKRISPQLFSLLLLLMEIVAIIIICWRGQELTNEAEELFQSFYQTKWIHCPQNIKTMILIIQERNKRPLSYKAGGLTEINWQLFGSIMNTAYSYFNLMFAMKEADQD